MRKGTLLMASVLVVTACGGPAPGDDQAADGGAPAAVSSEGVYRNVRDLGDGVYTYEFAPPGDPVTTVSMFVVTDEGVLVADGQGSPDETRRLLAAIGEVTDRPVTHLVICTDHADHTGGNSAFPEGVEIIAHPAADAALRAGAARTDRDADAPPVVFPTRLVSDRLELTLGGRAIEIAFVGRGHTAGDLQVRLPSDGIVFMSEAYVDRVFPLLRTGFPSEWVTVLKAAEQLDARTYIAGHGVRGSIDYDLSGLVGYRHALEQVIAEVTTLHDEGLDAEAAAAAADFGDLEQRADYSAQAARAVQRVYMDLDGQLPPAG